MRTQEICTASPLLTGQNPPNLLNEQELEALAVGLVRALENLLLATRQLEALKLEQEQQAQELARLKALVLETPKTSEP